MTTARPNFIVGIGGSAGGLNALTSLLGALPSDTGMSFVIVLHIRPEAESELAQVLSRHTKMNVMVAQTGMPIRANHIYVCPPNADLLIDSYTFKVVVPRSKANEQVNVLLHSLAADMGARAIGVILSGYDSDGTEGCKSIKAKRGTTFAQDASAEVQDMPLSAQRSGCIDFVLPPDKISRELQKFASAAPDNKSPFLKEQVARIFIAGTADDIAHVEQILGQRHEYTVARATSEARIRLKEQSFDLIMIGVHFDESRMFDLLREIRKTPEYAETPIICFCMRDTPLTRTMHDSADVLSRRLGAWMYLDQQEYSVSKDPDAEMRRVIERCLTGVARTKTQSKRMAIYRQREDIQQLREALESEDWSDELEDRVVELRRKLAILLRELCESHISSITQQEQIADSREQEDRVSEAVQSVENGAAYRERGLLMDETMQTMKELEIGEREETRRKKGRHQRGADKDEKKSDSGR